MNAKVSLNPSKNKTLSNTAIKYPRAKIYILANRLGRLKTDCKAHLEEMRSSGSRGLLRAFLDRYGMRILES